MVINHFEMIDISLMSYFLLIEVIYVNDDDIFIFQLKFISDILKKFKIESSKPILTLIKERLKLEKDNLSEFDNPTYFQRMVDSSHYLIFIRPDIIY